MRLPSSFRCCEARMKTNIICHAAAPKALTPVITSACQKKAWQRIRVQPCHLCKAGLMLHVIHSWTALLQTSTPSPQIHHSVYCETWTCGGRGSQFSWERAYPPCQVWYERILSLLSSLEIILLLASHLCVVISELLIVVSAKLFFRGIRDHSDVVSFTCRNSSFSMEMHNKRDEDQKKSWYLPLCTEIRERFGSQVVTTHVT